MKKLVFILMLLMASSAFGQTPKAADVKVAEPSKKNTIAIPADEAKALKGALEAAQKAADVLARANDQNEAAKAKLQALYWQIVATQHIDLDKYEPSTDETGLPQFIEKAAPVKVAQEEKKEK